MTLSTNSRRQTGPKGNPIFRPAMIEERSDHRPDLQGKYVYFARGERTKLIKIGFSTQPAARLRDMQVGTAEEISIIYTMPGTHADERKLHRLFRAHRERGEWFREEGRLYSFLREKDLHWVEQPECFTAVATPADLSALEGQYLRGFCTTEEARQKLYDIGLDELQVYMRGEHGGSELDACFNAFRNARGVLILAEDLRAFGDTKREVVQWASRLEGIGVTIIDMSNPGDIGYAALLHRANMLISNRRFYDKRRVHRLAKKGGEARGIEYEAKRNALLSANIVKRLVAESGLTLRKLASILGPPFNISTLSRHYGPNADQIEAMKITKPKSPRKRLA